MPRRARRQVPDAAESEVTDLSTIPVRRWPPDAVEAWRERVAVMMEGRREVELAKAEEAARRRVVMEWGRRSLRNDASQSQASWVR